MWMLNKSEKSIVWPITFGSLFEWYEVYLYFYWAPIISKSFFDLSLPLAEFLYAALILGVGLIARPIGGLLFGYIGDRFGRRRSFLISIIAITIPSIGIATMPSYNSWSYFSIIYIGLMRFLQGIPAGGELPGALCLLAEGAEHNRKRYICSFLFIGPQIGQILSIIQCFLLERYLSHEQLIDWGWRLSFWIAGAIGMLGFFLRRKLHESKSFENLQTHHKIEFSPLRESFKNHKKNLFIALLMSIYEVVGFFAIYFYLLDDSKILKFSSAQNLTINLFLLTFLLIAIPIAGKVGSNYSTKSLFNWSAAGVIATSIPFYIAVNTASTIWMFSLLIIIISLFCIQFSLLPSFLVDLFPTQVRFTCLGFSFNIADGVIGGFIPSIGFVMSQITGSQAGFVLLFPITALIFIISLKFVKTPEYTKNPH